MIIARKVLGRFSLYQDRSEVLMSTKTQGARTLTKNRGPNKAADKSKVSDLKLENFSGHLEVDTVKEFSVFKTKQISLKQSRIKVKVWAKQ